MTREEAREGLQGYSLFIADGTDLKEALNMAIEALLSDRPSGEWIDIDNYYRMSTCSHCQKVTMFEKWGEYTKPYNYCPNCGAVMSVPIQPMEIKGDFHIDDDYKKTPQILGNAEVVVRCRDCKFKRLYDEGDTKYYYCALEDRPNRNWSVDDTDYCAWGERREDGEA